MLCGYAMEFDIMRYKQQHEIWVCLHNGVYHDIPKFMAMGASQFSDKPVDDTAVQQPRVDRISVGIW